MGRESWRICTVPDGCEAARGRGVPAPKPSEVDTVPAGGQRSLPRLMPGAAPKPSQVDDVTRSSNQSVSVQGAPADNAPGVRGLAANADSHSRWGETRGEPRHVAPYPPPRRRIPATTAKPPKTNRHRSEKPSTRARSWTCSNSQPPCLHPTARPRALRPPPSYTTTTAPAAAAGTLAVAAPWNTRIHHVPAGNTTFRTPLFHCSNAAR